jgi:hypothetical protein
MTSAQELAAALAEILEGARIEQEVLGSGVVWINIWLGTQFVTVECSRTQGFGVSLVSDDDLGFGGHDRVFTDGSQVLAYVQQLLRSQG